jgi:hypothetical protein
VVRAKNEALIPRPVQNRRPWWEIRMQQSPPT